MLGILSFWQFVGYVYNCVEEGGLLPMTPFGEREKEEQICLLSSGDRRGYSDSRGGKLLPTASPSQAEEEEEFFLCFTFSGGPRAPMSCGPRAPGSGGPRGDRAARSPRQSHHGQEGCLRLLCIGHPSCLEEAHGFY